MCDVAFALSLPLFRIYSRDGSFVSGWILLSSVELLFSSHFLKESINQNHKFEFSSPSATTTIRFLIIIKLVSNLVSTRTCSSAIIACVYRGAASRWICGGRKGFSAINQLVFNLGTAFRHTECLAAKLSFEMLTQLSLIQCFIYYSIDRRELIEPQATPVRKKKNLKCARGAGASVPFTRHRTAVTDEPDIISST